MDFHVTSHDIVRRALIHHVRIAMGECSLDHSTISDERIERELVEIGESASQYARRFDLLAAACSRAALFLRDKDGQIPT